MFDFKLSLDTITQTAPFWGYPLLFFFMVIEGPVATMLGAFFASTGFFNVFAVYGLSILADIIGDLILYSIGKFGGRPALTKIENFFNFKKKTEEKIVQQFKKRGSRIIFYVKISTGLSVITFILAGIARMKISQFIKYSFLGGIIWSGFLVILGYFSGFAAEQISTYIKFASYITFIIVVLMIIIVNIYKKKLAKKILK